MTFAFHIEYALCAQNIPLNVGFCHLFSKVIFPDIQLCISNCRQRTREGTDAEVLNLSLRKHITNVFYSHSADSPVAAYRKIHPSHTVASFV